MAYCTKCGKELQEGDRFCGSCGAPVNGSGGAQKQTPTDGDKNRWILPAILLVLVVAVTLLVARAIWAPQKGTVEPAASSGTQGSAASVPSMAVQETTAPSPEVLEIPAAETASLLLTEIETRSGNADKAVWEPLAAYGDFNGDGDQDLLVLYRDMTDSQCPVKCELWSISPSGKRQMYDDTLYLEVGGNGGSVGIAQREGTTYLVLCWRESNGNGFHNYYRYIPWNSDGSLGDNEYYMERHGGPDIPDRYVLGDSTVEPDEFNEAQGKFDQPYQLDLLQGPAGDVRTFSEMHTYLEGVN